MCERGHADGCMWVCVGVGVGVFYGCKKGLQTWHGVSSASSTCRLPNSRPPVIVLPVLRLTLFSDIT